MFATKSQSIAATFGRPSNRQEVVDELRLTKLDPLRKFSFKLRSDSSSWLSICSEEACECTAAQRSTSPRQGVFNVFKIND